MPLATRESGPWRNLFDVYAEAYWLVMHFEGHVLPRMNQELQAQDKKTRDSVGNYRRDRWLTSAVALLCSHPLEEVVGVTDWLFDSCHGYLPVSVVDDDRQLKQDRKVTRIQQVADYYEELAEMALGNQPPKSAQVSDNWDIRANRGNQPWTNYGEPFTDPDLESKVSELVSSFTDFRTVCGDQGITDFRTWGWAKTFRIMLAKYSSEDIKAGIVALAACRDRVDVSRYHDAFHLNQEWQQVLGVVDLHKVIQQAAVKHFEPENRWESPPPSVSFLLDDDDDSPRYAKDSTRVRHIDMATNLEERRARYAARAAKNRGTA